LWDSFVAQQRLRAFQGRFTSILDPFLIAIHSIDCLLGIPILLILLILGSLWHSPQFVCHFPWTFEIIIASKDGSYAGSREFLASCSLINAGLFASTAMLANRAILRP
jgi:hypothetical protein